MAKKRGPIVDSPADDLDFMKARKDPSKSGCTYADSDFKDFPLVIGEKMGDEPQDLLDWLGKK